MSGSLAANRNGNGVDRLLSLTSRDGELAALCVRASILHLLLNCAARHAVGHTYGDRCVRPVDNRGRDAADLDAGCRVAGCAARSRRGATRKEPVVALYPLLVVGRCRW